MYDQLVKYFQTPKMNQPNRSSPSPNNPSTPPMTCAQNDMLQPFSPLLPHILFPIAPLILPPCLQPQCTCDILESPTSSQLLSYGPSQNGKTNWMSIVASDYISTKVVTNQGVQCSEGRVGYPSRPWGHAILSYGLYEVRYFAHFCLWQRSRTGRLHLPDVSVFM